jgi:serine/threonine protein kinase
MSDANKIFLIQQVESLELLDDRYAECKCINFAPGQPRRGYFSLVFKARDTVEQKDVAIKFFDPDCLGQVYRLQCFAREPEILVRLKSSPRCVQINGPMRTFALAIDLPDGRVFQAPCNYYVCDWIDDDIDKFFDRQDEIEAIAKLTIFRSIVSAINSVHEKGICHRDVQAKNFRLRTTPSDELVVVIDFGTAAAHDSAALLTEYGYPVGMLNYASPEAFLGMAGDRSIGKLTDVYSLGCLLFELFNKHAFYFVRDRDTEFQKALAALGLLLARAKMTHAKSLVWAQHVGMFRPLAAPPRLSAAGARRYHQR